MTLDLLFKTVFVSQLLVFSLKKISGEDLGELKSLNMMTVLSKTLGTILRYVIDKYNNHTNFST